MAIPDITGQRFGRLVALRVDDAPYRTKRWRFRCDCGVEIVDIPARIRSGHKRSCGCLVRDTVIATHTTHGQSLRGKGRKPSRLYMIWANMRARCTRPTSSFFDRYGGRGISVCPAWEDFQTFETWALSNGYDDALTIDRIDNDGNYEPGNCRWATRLEQTRNSTKARLIEMNGKLACIKEHAAEQGVPYEALRYRLNKGMGIAEAVAYLKERIR